MSATQATVTSTEVAVRYRRNVGSLSIDMLTDTRPMCRSRCVGQHSDRHIGRDIGRYVGRDVDRPIGPGVRKLHMIPFNNGDTKNPFHEFSSKHSSNFFLCVGYFSRKNILFVFFHIYQIFIVMYDFRLA